MGVIRQSRFWVCLLACSAVLVIAAGCGTGGAESQDDRRAIWAAKAADAGVPICGDAVCGHQEFCWSCASDCGPCSDGLCGDGICSDEEDCSHCPADCGGCANVCGDGTCDIGEDCARCADDCGVCPEAPCGDGQCSTGESCESCAEDCGICSVCGDDVCSADEDCDSCEADCSVCPDPCGDGVCAANESCASCAQDCGVCEADERIEALEGEMVVLVNEVRATGGDCPSGSFGAVGPLAVDDKLVAAARAHSLDMGSRAYFEHDTPEGVDPFTRMRNAGYTGSPGAENIAAGNATARETFEQWMGSDGHCRNIMDGSLDEIGVGLAEVAGSPYGFYWTQNFGRR